MLILRQLKSCVYIDEMLFALQLLNHDLTLLVIGFSTLTFEICLGLRPQAVLFEYEAGDKGSNVTVEFIVHDLKLTIEP